VKALRHSPKNRYTCKFTNPIGPEGFDVLLAIVYAEDFSIHVPPHVRAGHLLPAGPSRPHPLRRHRALPGVASVTAFGGALPLYASHRRLVANNLGSSDQGQKRRKSRKFGWSTNPAKNEMRKIGYARVSAPHQNLDRQIGALRAERCDEIYR